MAEFIFGVKEIVYPPGPYVLLEVSVSGGRHLVAEKEIDEHIDLCIRELNKLRNEAKKSLKKLIQKAHSK
jgi:hypothetical protein